ncbi:hypothetical protein [Solimonas sp. SE-A11]|uniref:hypothetical protein n=1 Tax=Solimonas sp. SE-A11 TaxID=3054954 RepID=UPI00259CB32F|nr:hypothetical protein [Solimonas sp. SE-A11]MDM4770856.1 hypothetical protein [Solimonas sp. SE-A11]
MNAKQLTRLFDLHRELGIPLVSTVSFAFRVQELSITEVMAEAGYSKASLYHTLIGKFEPREELRAVMKKRLGVDPWAWQLQGDSITPRRAHGGRRSQSTRSP